MALLRYGLGLLVVVSTALLIPNTGRAGVDECNNIRLEDLGSCEIRGNLECSASCTELGIYKKACATRLQTVCRTTCTVDAEAGCTDHCTVMCQEQCDAGINITCTHNCFEECEGSCTASCEGAADNATCMASCEATCDGECDVKCAPLVEASCYEHCIECCDGSCTAQANMDCQTNCQEEQFEDCEHEFRADCDASCSADGSVFCDGEYVLSGSQIPACIAALAAMNLAVEGEVEAMGTAKVGGCAAASGSDGGGLGILGGLAIVIWSRRRRAPRGRGPA